MTRRKILPSLRLWRKLSGKNLLRTVKGFAGIYARATAIGLTLFGMCHGLQRFSGTKIRTHFCTDRSMGGDGLDRDAHSARIEVITGCGQPLELYGFHGPWTAAILLLVVFLYSDGRTTRTAGIIFKGFFRRSRRNWRNRAGDFLASFLSRTRSATERWIIFWATGSLGKRGYGMLSVLILQGA